jgi:hypothetical protein
MKYLLLATTLLATPAHATDMTIKVPDTFKVTMQNTQIAFERCIGAVISSGDKASCAVVGQILTELQNLQMTPVPAATPSPTPAPSATP